MGQRQGKVPSAREAVFLQLLVSREKYGLELAEEYEQATGQAIPAGSLYVTLDRMQSAGFVKSRDGQSAHERGGNRRRYFKLTGEGARALDEHRTRVETTARVFGIGGVL